MTEAPPSIVNPQSVMVAAVEDDDGEIAASVYVLRVTHFEGLEIKPKYRGNAGIWRALLKQAYAVPRMAHEQFVLATPKAGDEVMRGVCQKLNGTQLHYELYALPVGE